MGMGHSPSLYLIPAGAVDTPTPLSSTAPQLRVFGAASTPLACWSPHLGLSRRVYRERGDMGEFPPLRMKIKFNLLNKPAICFLLLVPGSILSGDSNQNVESNIEKCLVQNSICILKEICYFEP